MESVFGRYRNLIVLVGVLFAQILGLAVQVKRTRDSEPTRLIRIWTVGAVSPLEKALSWVQNSSGNVWHNYFYLRGVRAENRELKHEIEQMRLEQARMAQDADQAHRLQALLGFKEQFIAQTTAAQVIGGSGSDLSHVIYIDKGYADGIKPDMAVVTKDGIVGKVLRADHRHVSQVLLIDDQTSGVGAILEKSRLQGILRGTSSGAVVLEKVMSDENVPVGEQVLTSGGDGIFPKGLPVGTVTKVSSGNDLFLNIRVHPAAELSRIEEVLVVTKIDEKQAEPDQNASARAVDILAERLPTVPPKPETAATAAGQAPAGSKPGAQTPGKQTSATPNAALTKSPAANAPAASGTTAATTVAPKPKPAPPPSTGPGAPATGTANSQSAVTKKSATPPSTPGTAAASATTTSPAAGAAKKPPAKSANPNASAAPPQPPTQDTPQ
jgi:rod shape-determining protein MreC